MYDFTKSVNITGLLCVTGLAGTAKKDDGGTYMHFDGFALRPYTPDTKRTKGGEWETVPCMVSLSDIVHWIAEARSFKARLDDAIFSMETFVTKELKKQEKDK